MRSSQQGPLPYLSFCGVEVANAARTVAYLRNGLGDTGQGRWELGAGNLCSVLYRLGGGSSHGTYISPAIDPAPWYDATEPGSRSFLGAIMLGLTGYDSTLTRTSTRRIVGLGGGTFGGQQRTVREWKFRAALVNGDDYGAEFGLRWLTEILQSSNCVGCETCDLTVRLVCPPDDGSNDSLGEWMSYEVALTDGPHEVTQYSSMPADDVLAGCRDYTIVEWTMEAGNPFLYKRPVALASANVNITSTVCDAAGIPVTTSGYLITDEMRALGEEGDGRAPESSIGFYGPSGNEVANSSVETNLAGWTVAVGGTLARVTALAKFGSWSVRYSAAGAAPGEGFKVTTDPNNALGIGAGLQFSGTVWLCGAVGGEQLEIVGEIVNSDGSITASFLPATPITLTTGWQQFRMPDISTNPPGGQTADFVRLIVRNRTGNPATPFSFYADAATILGGVIETTNEFYQDPFILTDGSYVRKTLAGKATFDGNAAFNSTGARGWAAFRVRADWASASWAIGFRPNLFAWRLDSTHYIAGDYSPSTQSFVLATRNGGGAETLVSVPHAILLDDVIAVVFAWNGTSGKVSVNGSPFVSATIPDMTSFLASTVTLSRNGNLPAQYTWSGEYFWGAFGTGTLSDADAAAIAAIGDQVSQGTLQLGIAALPAAVPTVVWDATSLQGICAFLFGPPTEVLCKPVTPPVRGAIGAVFTLTSTGGFGPILFEGWASCNHGSSEVDGPPLQMEISGIPAGSTVVVDCGRHTVTVTDANGTTDGSYLLQLPDGRGLEWIESRDCDNIGCFCVAVPSCGVGSFNVALSTQSREG